MVRQWRHATGRALLEIPAGTLEPGEPPEVTARRELAEECGLAAATWEAGPQFFTAPGFCTELMHLFLATDLTDAPGQADPDEQLEPSWMSLDDALAAVDDGRIADCQDHGRRRLAGPPPRPLRSRAGTPVAECLGRMTLEPNDPEPSAEEAGLRYVTDAMPGIRRRRAGKGFSYIGPDGARIADPDRVAWIRSARHPAGLDRRLDLARSVAATSRRPAATRAAASSTATTRAGARSATRRSTGG